MSQEELSPPPALTSLEGNEALTTEVQTEPTLISGVATPRQGVVAQSNALLLELLEQRQEEQRKAAQLVGQLEGRLAEVVLEVNQLVEENNNCNSSGQRRWQRWITAKNFKKCQ